MAEASPATTSSLQLQAFSRGEFFKLRADRDAADRLLQKGQDRLLALAAIEIQQQRLYRADHRGRKRQRAVAQDRQSERADRLRGEFSAQRDRLAVFPAFISDVLERAQDRRRKRVEAVRHARVSAVRGIK